MLISQKGVDKNMQKITRKHLFLMSSISQVIEFQIIERLSAKLFCLPVPVARHLCLCISHAGFDSKYSPIALGY